MMRVGELMSRDVHVCHEGDNLDAAVQLMWEHDIGAVPVLDRDHRLTGIITDRDIAMTCHLQGKTAQAINVGETMHHDVLTCRESDELDTAHRAMVWGQVRRLPVVDEQRRVVGILSLNDLATAMREHDAPLGLRPVDVARTLQSICAHRPPVARLAAPAA